MVLVTTLAHRDIGRVPRTNVCLPSQVSGDILSSFSCEYQVAQKLFTIGCTPTKKRGMTPIQNTPNYVSRVNSTWLPTQWCCRVRKLSSREAAAASPGGGTVGDHHQFLHDHSLPPSVLSPCRERGAKRGIGDHLFPRWCSSCATNSLTPLELETRFLGTIYFKPV